MPKTGFRSPTTDDTPEYIRDYIQYKFDKMTKHSNQIKKLYSHIQKAEKVLDKKGETGYTLNIGENI